MSSQSLRLMAVRFKRAEESEMEMGVMINDEKLIIDMRGDEVKAPIWEYTLVPFYGSMVVIG